MNRLLRAVVCGIAGGLLATMLLACTLEPENHACAPEGELGKIEAAYVAEALQACRGHGYDDCPKLPAIREKYQKARDAWVQCR